MLEFTHGGLCCYTALLVRPRKTYWSSAATTNTGEFIKKGTRSKRILRRISDVSGKLPASSINEIDGVASKDPRKLKTVVGTRSTHVQPPVSPVANIYVYIYGCASCL